MLFPILYWASGHYYRGLSGLGGIYRWTRYKNSPQGSSKRKVKGHFRNIDHFIKRTHAATVVGKNAATFLIIVTIVTSSDWYKTTARPHKCTLRDWTIVSDSQCFCSFYICNNVQNRKIKSNAIRSWKSSQNLWQDKGKNKLKMIKVLLMTSRQIFSQNVRFFELRH